jgi:hypothetical protein
MKIRNPSLPATLAGLLAACALAIAGCGSSGSDGNADQAPIDGSWKGTYKQGSETFEGYVEIDTLREGMVSGTAFYPGIGNSGECSGAPFTKARTAVTTCSPRRSSPVTTRTASSVAT